MDYYIFINVALTLDSLMGEPTWLWSRLPHPARIMGLLIDIADQKMNQGTKKRLAGVAAVLLLGAVFATIGLLITALPFGWVFEIIMAAILIGHRSLVQHVSAVASALDIGLPEGRHAVSMIVGRDTQNLDASAVSRGAIESAAENFSDGVVAPVFWFLLFGLPGILVYKLVNTADSMIGYRNECYLQFGWAAARIDDVMNFIPARISAVLLALSGFSLSAFRLAYTEAKYHRSPNAGWPEAAMAALLGVALSGPRMYGGQLTDDSYVNATGKMELGAQDIRNAVGVLWRSWVVMLGLIMAVWGCVWLITP